MEGVRAMAKRMLVLRKFFRIKVSKVSLEMGAMVKRMLVLKRYFRIKASSEMERLVLRAQKGRAYIFTHQNMNLFLGTTGVGLAIDAKLSSNTYSRDVMEKLPTMEKQLSKLSICTSRWYMGRWTPPPLPMWYQYIGLPHSRSTPPPLPMCAPGLRLVKEDEYARIHRIICTKGITAARSMTLGELAEELRGYGSIWRNLADSNEK